MANRKKPVVAVDNTETQVKQAEKLVESFDQLATELLELPDYILIVSLIEHAQKSGIIPANDMKGVGDLWLKLVGIVQALQGNG